MRRDLASCSPAWDFWGDQLVDLSGGISSAVCLSGCDTTFLPDIELQTVSGALTGMLAEIPDGMMLRFYSVELFPHRSRLQTWVESFAAGTLASKMAQERATDCLLKAAPRRRELYAVLTALPHMHESPLGGLLPAHQDLESDLVAGRQRLVQAGRIFATHLRSLGMGVDFLGRAAFFNLIWRLANPKRAQSLPTPLYKEGVALRRQLFVSGLYNGMSGFQRDGEMHRVVTMRDIPQSTVATQALYLQKLSFPHVTTVTLRNVRRETALKRVQKTVYKAFDWQKYMLPTLRRDSGELPDIDLADTFSDSQQLLRKLKDGDSMWDIAVQVLISAPDERELDHCTDSVMSAMRKCGEAEGSVEDYRSHIAYLGLLPGHHRLIGDRFQPILGSAAADLIPLYKENEGDADPTYFLTTKNGGLVGWHPFAKDRGSNNLCLLGTTGAGKSYTARNLTAGFVAQGGRLHIVTRGSDYDRYVELFGGEVNRVRLDDPELALGPFFAPGPACTPERMTNLASILGVLCKEADGQLTRVQKRLLFSSVQALYRKAGEKTPDLDAWIEELLALRQSEPEMSEEVEALAQQARFWSEGPYRRVFLRNRAAHNAKVVVWNLEQVDEDTSGAVLALISAIIDDSIRLGRTIVMFDEVWSFLSSAAGAWLISNFYRTVRRAGSAIWSASQSINDILAQHPQVKSALLNNSSILVLLEQKAAELPDVVDAFGLNPQAADLLSKCKSLLGESSSMLMLKPHAQHFISLRATPLEYWMATSHKPDVDLEADVRRCHPAWSRMQALEFLAERFPNGAV